MVQIMVENLTQIWKYHTLLLSNIVIHVFRVFFRWVRRWTQYWQAIFFSHLFRMSKCYHKSFLLRKWFKHIVYWNLSAVRNGSEKKNDNHPSERNSMSQKWRAKNGIYLLLLLQLIEQNNVWIVRASRGNIWKWVPRKFYSSTTKT